MFHSIDTNVTPYRPGCSQWFVDWSWCGSDAAEPAQTAGRLLFGKVDEVQHYIHTALEEKEKTILVLKRPR